MVSSVTPSEYGQDFYASQEEMLKHAGAEASNISASVSEEDSQWMSQWSPEEELIAVHASDMQAPWDQQGHGFRAAAFVAIIVLFGAALARTGAPILSKKATATLGVDCSSKQHYV